MSNKGEECMELKNIKYKTMLQHNKAIQSNLPSSDNISQFLEKEKKINSKKPWTRLQKSVKLEKCCSECLNCQRFNQKIGLWSLLVKLQEIQGAPGQGQERECRDLEKLFHFFKNS